MTEEESKQEDEKRRKKKEIEDETIRAANSAWIARPISMSFM